MSLVDWAKRELAFAGYTEDCERPNSWIRENVIELLEVFAEQGHSGSSAPFVISLFNSLANYKTISPLTGADEEWVEVGEGIYQNNRCSGVFKQANKKPYYIDGRVFWEWYSDPEVEGGKPFKTYYTSKDSFVDIEFPWNQPKHPEYVFCPTEQFPNEIID